MYISSYYTSMEEYYISQNAWYIKYMIISKESWGFDGNLQTVSRMSPNQRFKNHYSDISLMWPLRLGASFSEGLY